METYFLERLRLQLVTEFLVSRPRPDVVSALCSRVLYVGLGGVVVGLEYSGDPHPPTPGAVEVESCAGAIPPPCTTCYNATIAPPCKHPEGGWVLVGAGGCSPCGRRVPRHPPRRHNTQHGTSPPAPGRAVHGPAGHQAGSTAADREVGGAQLSRDANANSGQLFAGIAKVVESCRKFSSATG